MTAIASSTSELQFLSDDARERRASRCSHIAMGAVLIIVLCSMTSALIYASKADREVGQQYAAKLTLYTEAAQRILLARETMEKQQRIAVQAASEAALLERTPRSSVLADLTASLPDGVSLQSFALDTTRRGSATQAGDAGTGDVSIKLTAIADSDANAAQFVERLNRSKIIFEAKLVPGDPGALVINEGDGKTVRTFGVEAILDSSAVIQPMFNGKTMQASASTSGSN